MQTMGNIFQQQVTDIVADGVVNIFKTVEIKKDYRQQFSAAARHIQCIFEFLIQ